MNSRTLALALLLIVIVPTTTHAEPRLQDIDFDGPNTYGPKPGPHPALVTLHMRATTDHPLNVELATSTAMHRGRRGGRWRSATTTVPLCTTPCDAVVPWGLSFFVIKDAPTGTEFKLPSAWLNDNSTLNIHYASHEFDRQQVKRHALIGGTIGAVVGYATSALCFGFLSSHRWHYYSADPAIAAGGAMYGAVIGILATGQYLDDNVSTSVTPDR